MFLFEVMINRKYTTSFLLFCLCYSVSSAQKIFIIKLKSASDAKVSVNAAPLKYNKHMAFSFTLDDGYRSAFTCAYPLLNGGTVSKSIPDEYHNDSGGDGQTSAGLFYTDGCGNQVPFKLAVALNAGIVYDKPDNRARLSWPEVQQLYNSGWDILNHGYHHLSKHGTDYNSEVLENIKLVKEKIGFTMTQFVVPGGEHDPGYEHLYENDAFASGAFAVASYVGVGPAIRVDRPVNLDRMIYARDLLNSNKDSVNLRAVDKQLLKMDSLMKQPYPVWYNAFTHNAGNGNLWSISLIYPEFKYLMTSLANRYGKNGSDELWMAPWQQVYEYVWLRDHIKVATRQSGRNVTIRLEIPEIPPTFRYADISLHIKTNSKFAVSPSGLISSDNGNGKHDLINIHLNKP
jgi:peptidoglycan/xylan/chitin deacetylase (PgdA/CDA1 family)